MENQLIREQVFDVLFNYVKIADGIFTESDCATVRDEICLRIDQSQFTADEAEDYINQEVEKRIAERMPSEEETIVEAENLYPTVYKNDGLNKIDDAYNHMQLDKRIGFKQGCEWFRNRMEESK